MQEFKIEKKYITLMKVCLVVFMAFLALGFALPFFPDEEGGNIRGTLFVTLLCTVVFGTFSVITWRTLRKLPYANIAIDDDGIWYMHTGKENGLVPWGKIARVKERSYQQCLDLLDYNGARLLKVEYQLNGFEIIRNTLNEKTSRKTSARHQSKFQKSQLYHMFYGVAILGFAALGFYVGSNGNPVLGYGGMGALIVIIIHEYVASATGVIIANGCFEITYPFTSRNVPFADIEDIRIVDTFNKGNRISQVWIVSKKAKKPFKLTGLGADSIVLYQTLRNAAKVY